MCRSPFEEIKSTRECQNLSLRWRLQLRRLHRGKDPGTHGREVSCPARRCPRRARSRRFPPCAAAHEVSRKVVGQSLLLAFLGVAAFSPLVARVPWQKCGDDVRGDACRLRPSVAVLVWSEVLGKDPKQLTIISAVSLM